MPTGFNWDAPWQEQSVAPDTPATGRWKIYPKADGWYVIDDAGVEYPLVVAGGSTSFTGNITITKADPSIILNTATATDTDFWIGVQEDAGGDNDDLLQFGTGTSPGTGALLSLDKDGGLTFAGAPATLKPASNSVTALQVAQADGTAWVNFDTTNKAVEIIGTGASHTPGTSSRPLSVYGDISGTVADFYNGAANVTSLMRIGNLTAVSTSNVAGFEMRLNTSTNERAAGRVTVAFTDTTDATRTSSILFATNDNGAFNNNAALVAKQFGVGTTTPGATGHFLLTNTDTNVVANVAILGHNSSGTPAAAFGTGLLFQGKSSSANAQDMARMRTYWNTATHASRKAYALLSAFDTAERDVIGWGASGTAALLGFYGIAAAPVVQPATTGTATGFTAGTGTAVNDDSTFTGGTGATAYRISDVVLALKQLGLLAA